jgi:DNA-binding SARP family transcriptional activator
MELGAIGRKGGCMPLVRESAASWTLPPSMDAGVCRSTTPLLAVRILGRLHVSLNGVAVEQWPSGRGRSLFKYLVAHRDQWPLREVLMETFWPNSPPPAARNSLHVAVHGLRRALRAAADLPVVVLQDGAYRLAGDLRLWIDVEQFQRHADAAGRLERAGEETAATTEYEHAASLYRGDLLADEPYEDWPVLARERLRLAHLDVQDRLSRLYFDQQRYGASAALCREMLERDTCLESVHRRLIRCYARLGHPHLALRQYLACAAALRSELGVDPAPATVRLWEAIRRQEAV